MVRVSLILLLSFSTIKPAGAEEPADFIRAGLLKASATISPGFMLRHASTSIYVNSELEYFTDRRISLRGDAYWFLGSQQKPELLRTNNHLLFGALCHFPKNRFDYFVGLQPGFSVTQPNLLRAEGGDYPSKALPAISLLTGITYYVHDYFNFFIEARYIHSRYYSISTGGLRLEELTISGGLGLQLHTKKGK